MVILVSDTVWNTTLDSCIPVQEPPFSPGPAPLGRTGRHPAHRHPWTSPGVMFWEAWTLAFPDFFLAFLLAFPCPGIH